MRKYITYSGVLLLMLSSIAGCKKFLTKEIVGDYPETAFYKTQAQAILAINAAYQPLSFSSARNSLWVFGDVASDDAEKGGDPGDQADIGLIDALNITPINGNLENMWANLYEGVSRCNIVLTKVPPISMDAGADIGRITSGAATALLAKAYLFQNKWSQVITTVEPLIASGKYDLMQLYTQNFSAANKNNKESVFEIQHLNGQDPFTGNMLNQWFAPRVDAGYGFDAPTQNFVNEFETSPGGKPDPRLDYTVGRDSMPWFNGEIFLKDWSPTGYLTRKHQQPFSEIPKNLKGDGSLNYVAIRYADVLLWYAEALNEMGRSADALVQVNRIRKRARESYLYDIALPGFGTIPIGLLPNLISTNPADVRRAVQHERRVELGFEFHRFFDMIRWGETYATAAMSDRPNFNYTKHKNFPIPQSERDRNHALH